MRIESQPGQNVSDSSRAAATRSAGTEAGSGHIQPSSTGTDQVSLSGASNLLALSKNLPSEKQQKILALTNQISSGSYKPDAAATSRSLVQQHLNS